MFFSRRAFLGQVPLGQKITSGKSTYVAQELCKALEAETKEPGKYTQKIKDLWGEVRGISWMEDEVKGWMSIWCPNLMMTLEFKVAGRIFPPTPKPPEPPRPPVPTPGRGQQLNPECYECGPGNYQLLLPVEAQARGCTKVFAAKCYPTPVSGLPPIPTVDISWRPWMTAFKPPSSLPPPSIEPIRPPVATPRVSQPPALTTPTGIPTPTPGSAPVGVCPAGQFWDGRQCRGSIAPGLNVFSQAMNLAPSGISPLTAAPGDAMPYTAFGGLSGRRIPISNP